MYWAGVGAVQNKNDQLGNISFATQEVLRQEVKPTTYHDVRVKRDAKFLMAPACCRFGQRKQRKRKTLRGVDPRLTLAAESVVSCEDFSVLGGNGTLSQEHVPFDAFQGAA